MIEAYVPKLLINGMEPFLPKFYGWTLYEDGDESKSFKRVFRFGNSSISRVIEFAIYWDYDITHLYDLEHVWVYVDDIGEVIDVESSFHGKVIKGLKKSRENLEGRKVVLYCQPGKHALVPELDQILDLDDYEKCCMDNVGKDGLIITQVAKGRYHSYPGLREKIIRYMKPLAFKPGEEWISYDFKRSQLLPWDQLNQLIPIYIGIELKKIEAYSKKEKCNE